MSQFEKSQSANSQLIPLATPEAAQQRHRILMPLSVAVSALMFAACSSTPSKPHSSTQRSLPTVSQSAKSSTAVASSNLYGGALLDAESLDELADLLEATDMTMVEDNKLAIQQYGDLWDRLRAGYRMNHNYGYNARIEAQKNWFITRQDYLNRLTARASRYLYHTVREAERRNIPTELALLPVIESSYDPSATSNAAAAGLWQFIPSTGRIYGLNQSSSYDGRRDVIESTRAAYDFLTTLYNQFGSWELALAAYNAGPGRIQNAIDRNAAQGLPTDYWSLRLPTETMNYVPRFMAVADIVSKPNQYSVYLPAIANRQHFRSVPVNYGVSLSEIAQVTGVSYSELQNLNPALTAARIDVSGPQRVVIPNDVNVTVDAKLSSLQGGWQAQGGWNASSSSASVTPSVSNYDRSALPSTGAGLADYAASASVPRQTSSYIAPSTMPSSSSVYSNQKVPTQEPAITTAEAKQIDKELALSNSLPTTAAQVTANNTIIQEPPLTSEERDFIAKQIQTQTPEVAEVVSPVDGNIKLAAVQTQQSVLEAKGEDKKLSFATAASSPTSKPKPQGKRSTYTVARGDTLSNIATRAGVNWRDIAEWNQINPDASLYVGTTLYLYDAKPIAAIADSKPNATAAQPESYVVQSGDTLIGTANKFGLSVSELAKYNNLNTNANLLRGQKLWLVDGKVKPSSQQASASTERTQTYQVKAGDGLIALARQFNISLDTLASMNGLASNDTLYVGQTLKIPASVNLKAAAFNVSSANSSTRSSDDSKQVATTSYTVKSGDTLIGIANSLGVSAADIAAVNRFEANARLQRGQRIQVPASSKQVQLKLQNQPVSYTVQAGDTLTGVANRYGVSLSELAAANDLTTRSNLIRGRTLTIPVAGSSTKTATASSSQASNAGSVITNTESYTVRSGDSLIALANRYQVSVADLAATNKLATNAGLLRGQTLQVPKLTTSYTVRSGDSLIGLARKYGISPQELAQMNDIAADTMLQRGQKLTVPNK